MTRLWPQGAAVEVWDRQNPAEFTWQGALHRIDEVCNRWRLHTCWWEEGQAIWREYVKMTTDTGLLCLLYHDLPDGDWFLARVYD